MNLNNWLNWLFFRMRIQELLINWQTYAFRYDEEVPQIAESIVTALYRIHNPDTLVNQIDLIRK